jgi:hypothetical protein
MIDSPQQGSNHLGISGKSLYKGQKPSNGATFVKISASMTAKMYKIALTRQSGRIMYDPNKEKHEQHRTCWCHRGTPNAADSMTVKGVVGESARLHGVITCKSVWACPTCSSKICATRQAEVAAAMKAHIAAGGYVFLVTRTFPHEFDMPLDELLTKEGKARTDFRNSRRWRDGKNARTGYICSLEVTSGERNGWHPHTHELVFATPDAFGETKELEGGRLSSRLIDELKEAWYMALRKAGLCEQSQMSDVLAHGLDVRGGQYAAEYVAKFGRDQKWGLSREITMHAQKVGSDAKGAHPFQLLAWAEQGDGDAALKFREYVEAFDGKRMLSWSKGLKKLLLNEEEMTDEEAADKELPDEVDFGRIDSEALSVLQARNLLPNFLGFVAEYCTDPEQAQAEMNEYIAWARTVPRTGRGDVKVKMWSRSDYDPSGRKGFKFVDRSEQ